MKNQDSLQKTSPSIRGSVLILILVAIALFGALSFAMTQGMRGGTTQLTDQQAKLAASEIIEYLTKVKSAFDGLVINGCDPINIDFSTPLYLRNDGTVLDTAPSNTTAACGLYTREGANITPAFFLKSIAREQTGTASNGRSSHFYARYIDVTGFGTTAHDLTYFAKGFKPEVCLALLKMVSPEQNYTEVPADLFDSAAPNSYTIGTPGTLNPVSIPASSKIYSNKNSAEQDFCLIGIILKVN